MFCVSVLIPFLQISNKKKHKMARTIFIYLNFLSHFSLFLWKCIHVSTYIGLINVNLCFLFHFVFCFRALSYLLVFFLWHKTWNLFTVDLFWQTGKVSLIEHVNIIFHGMTVPILWHSKSQPQDTIWKQLINNWLIYIWHTKMHISFIFISEQMADHFCQYTS